MSNFAFPTLDSLDSSRPKRAAPATTGWVEGLGDATLRTSVVARGWTPPTIDSLNATLDPDAIDIEEIKRVAQDEGFRQGYTDGLMSGTERGTVEGRREGLEQALLEERKKLEEFSRGLAEVVASVDPAVERWKEALESQVTDMAMNAVRALLAAELAIGRPEAMGIVREALGHAEGALKATIRLSPPDRAALAERKDEILAACTGLRNVELVDDASIIGGCIIETENGVVDATMNTRLTLWEAA